MTERDAGKLHEEILIRFSNYMKERRYAPRTIDAYIECLRIFFCFHAGKKVLELDNSDVEAFNQGYILAKQLSATYQSQFVNAIKLFYAKIPGKRIVIQKIERPRQGKHLPKVIAQEELARIIGATGNLKETKTELYRFLKKS